MTYLMFLGICYLFLCLLLSLKDLFSTMHYLENKMFHLRCILFYILGIHNHSFIYKIEIRLKFIFVPLYAALQPMS